MEHGAGLPPDEQDEAGDVDDHPDEGEDEDEPVVPLLPAAADLQQRQPGWGHAQEVGVEVAEAWNKVWNNVAGFSIAKNDSH